MRKTLILIATLLATSAFAEGDDHDHDDHAAQSQDSSHKAQLDDIHLLHAWTTATDDDTALVFVEIENEGDAPVTLIGATSSIAQAVELVGFQLKDGADHYAPLDTLPIAAGTHLDLEPRGVAFQLSGLSAHLHEGDEFDISILFDTGTVTMTGQIEASDATQHSHAGHNH